MRRLWLVLIVALVPLEARPCVVLEREWSRTFGALSLRLHPADANKPARTQGERGWVLEGSTPQGQWSTPSAYAAQAALSPDAKRLVLWTGESFWVRDAASGELLQTLRPLANLSREQRDRMPLSCAGAAEWLVRWRFIGAKLHLWVGQLTPPPQTTNSGKVPPRALAPVELEVDLEKSP